MSQQQEVQVKDIAAYLLHSLNNNQSMVVPTREAETMTLAKQWLQRVATAEAPADDEDKKEDSSEGE